MFGKRNSFGSLFGGGALMVVVYVLRSMGVIA